MRKLIVFFVRTLLCFVFYVFAWDLAACFYMWNKSSSDDLKKGFKHQDLTMCKLIALFVRGLLCFVFHVFACVLSLRLFYKVDRQKDKSWESSVTMLKSFISHFSAVNSYVRHFVEHFFHCEYWLNVCSYRFDGPVKPSLCVLNKVHCADKKTKVGEFRYNS